MKSKEMKEELEIPEGVEIKVEGKTVNVKGPKGECKKLLPNPKITIKVEGKKVLFTAKKTTKRDKTSIWSYASHIKNMIKGATEGHVYKLKVCSGHFPMNVAVAGKDFVVKNFLGEKKPRQVAIKEGVEVKVEGEIVTVESCDKEIAGQTAADIETLTRITNRDLRIFQDGIYITEKDGKPVR